MFDGQLKTVLFLTPIDSLSSQILGGTISRVYSEMKFVSGVGFGKVWLNTASGVSERIPWRSLLPILYWLTSCARLSFCFLLSYIVDLPSMLYSFRFPCMPSTASDLRTLGLLT